MPEWPFVKAVWFNVFFFRSIFLFTFLNNCKVAGLVIFATIIECLFNVSTLIIQEYIPKILVSSYFICVYQCFKNKQNHLCIFQVLIFRANQWTGFYMIRTSILKEFNTSKINRIKSIFARFGYKDIGRNFIFSSLAYFFLRTCRMVRMSILMLLIKRTRSRWLLKRLRDEYPP